MSGPDPKLRGQHLHFDGISGAAGDMTLGAMIHLGVPEDVFRDAVVAMGLPAGVLRIERVVKGGIAAVDVKVAAEDEGHRHHHYPEIVARIRGAGLPAETEVRALDMFERVADAEARLHGTTRERVALHEVGAVDSIVDIVGAAAGLAALAPQRVTSSPVAMGSGSVRCAHGRLPVPSPAALEILRRAGGAMAPGAVTKELCTPTGAAILASSVSEWGPPPPMVPIAIGYGAGDADLDEQPNVLRLLVGAPIARAGRDTVRCIEANIDDMPAELCGHVAELLFAAGARDVWWTPITGKKSRPALVLSTLCDPDRAAAVTDTIFRETTTLGVRTSEVERQVLARETQRVDTPYGEVEIKLGRRGSETVNAAPEYESCRAAAAATGVPLKEVYAAAVAAYRSRSGG